MHQRAHDWKWTVLVLSSGTVIRFASEEEARSYALTYGYDTPLRLIPPIYA